MLGIIPIRTQTIIVRIILTMNLFTRTGSCVKMSRNRKDKRDPEVGDRSLVVLRTLVVLRSPESERVSQSMIRNPFLNENSLF